MAASDAVNLRICVDFFFLLKYKHYLQSENGIANVSDQVKFIWSLSVFVPLSHTAHWVHKATSRRLFEVVLSIKTRISWENQSDPIFTEEALRDLCSVMLLKTSRNSLIRFDTMFLESDTYSLCTISELKTKGLTLWKRVATLS